ncbi:hypothetical protein L2520_03670 [Limosilactobacillus vaginalis]|uniref:Uncharacterized protein n=1 Tax=Limosilactobacillus vaginalis TaxID=1633 RepID=A0ABT4K783_9LACO|nr:hypothetical protein [Limosilactobacillus vaginalis]MCZ3746521.1 hypothetical protein [Limosilactobacillus vaginalis]MCZ3751587.1 hypothetical protein [Limosilactobacillus vaginalis]MCZ3753273.1 hypothetical protein [Limosilactobacillus vaginalis]MCZ3755041.1 hypothetical protein [Limosilactobacillus vaginalis]MCZ3756759.1 hypothetical protein [Limosilactobacillus vaginalis]
MAKCIVCGKALGLFSSKIKTKDDDYICMEDAQHYFGSDEQAAFHLSRALRTMTSEQILKEVKSYIDEEKKQQQEYEEKLNSYRIMDLPSVAQKVSAINLKKNEYAYYAYNHNIVWLEERSRTSRINYGGLTGRIHIAKGLNYRLGSIKTDIQHETYLKQIFNGLLLLTNKRIILLNNEGAKAYPFTRLLKAIPYTDGVVLCSESGKKVILEGFNDANPFNIVLDRLLTEDDVLPSK